MSLKGNLQSVDLANVLQMLSINQKEGSLVLFDGETRKSIYFSRDGVSMLSRGRRGTDSLGRVLLRYGKLTTESLQTALQKQRDEGKRLGQVLQEMGLVTAEDIENAIRTQIEEEIYNLFIWKEASFEFLEGPPPPSHDETPTRVTFNVNSLILEAQRRADEWNWIRGLVPSLDEIYRPTEKLAEAEVNDDVFHYPFAPRVLEVLQQGSLNVGEIIEVSCAGKFEVCKILAILLEQDAIRPLQLSELQGLAQEAAGKGEHKQAAKFYSRIVELGGATPHVNIALGYSLEALEEPERASMFLRAAAESYVEGLQPGPAFDAYLRIARTLPTDLAAVSRLIEIASDNADILQANKHEVVETGRRLALCLKEMGRLPMSLQVLTRLVHADPSDLALRTLLVQVYQESGMMAEAVGELEAMAAACAARQNYEEAIRCLRKVMAIDRNREGVARKIEQYTKARDSGKRMMRRLTMAGALVAIAGAAAFGWYQHSVGSQRKTEELNRKANEELEPGRKQYDEARERLAEAMKVVAAWEESGGSELQEGAKTAEACLKAMANALQVNEKKAQFIYDQHPGSFSDPEWPRELVKPHRLTYEARKAEFDQKRTAATEGAARLGAEGRTLIESGRPFRAVAKFERSLLLMRAFQATPQDIAKAEQDLATVVSYREKLAAAQAAHDAEWDKGERAPAQARLAEFLTAFVLPADFVEAARFRVHVHTVPRGARVKPIVGPDAGKEFAVGAEGQAVQYTLSEGLVLEVSAAGFLTRRIEILLPKDALDAPAILKRFPHDETIVLDKVPTWSASLGKGPLEAEPCAEPGGAAILQGSRDGTLHRVAVADGSVRTFDSLSASGFVAGPACTGSVVFAGTLDGAFFAVDLPAMTLRWKVEPRDGPGPIRARPAIVGDTVVVAGEGGTVIAYDTTAAAPRVVWRLALPRNAATRLPLIPHGSRVLSLGMDGVIRSLGAGPAGPDYFEIHPSGQQERQYPAPVGAALVLPAGKFLFGQARSGRAGAFVLMELPATGTPGTPRFGLRWTCPENEAEPVGGCLLGDDLLLLFSNGNHRRIPSGRDPRPTDVAVPLPTADAGPLGPPVAAGGRVYIGTPKGLTCLEPAKSGFVVEWRWAAPEGKRLSTPLLVLGDKVYVGADDGTIYALLREARQE